MSNVIEKELFKNMVTKDVYISNSWLEVDINGKGLIYLVELDKNNCLKQKYVLPVERYNPLDDNFIKGVYRISYNPDSIKEFEPVVITNIIYLREI